MSEEFNESVVPLANVVSSFRDDITEPIDWQIQPTPGDYGAGVDFVEGVLAVPLWGDSHSRQIQLRKLIELRCSPTDPKIFKQLSDYYKSMNSNMPVGVLQASEAARISAITDKFAKSFGIVVEPNGSEKTRGKQLATAGTTGAWDQAVEQTLKLNSDKAFDSFASGIRSVKPEWSKSLRKLRKQINNTFMDSARLIGNTTPTDYGNDVKAPEGFRYSLYAASIVRDYLSDGYKAPNDMQELKRIQEDKRAKNYGKPDPSDLSDDGKLSRNEMEIEDDLPEGYEFETDDIDGFYALRIDDTLPLIVEVPGYMHRKRKAMTSGRRIAYPSRMLTDPQRRVFGTKQRVKGGIVVIDISGSMRLSNEDIESIVNSAPAAVIIAYSDCGDDPAPNAWILANRGWRVKDIGNIGGSNNGVDGPALTWAIRHRHRNESIVWVTDGQVTGKQGSLCNNLAKECAKLVKQHKIIMIPSVEEAVKQFKAGRLINKPEGRVRDALLSRF